MPQVTQDNSVPEGVGLKRTVGLVGLVLYGLGVTIGAGIYVLVGETVVVAGQYAPAAFLLSAVVMGFTAGSFAELSARVPRAAGEAVYVEEAFHLPALTVLVGLVVLGDAMIAAAAISVGAAGYVGELVALPRSVIIAAIVLFMGAIAAWGIRESIAIAGAMTLVEVAGLVIIIGAGVAADPHGLTTLPSTLAPPLGDMTAIFGVLSASLLTFFAFIGFDDIANLVEEARNPRRDLPRALIVTLALVTLIYVLVSFVAVRGVTVEEIAATDAPISLMFERLTGLPPLAITLIAVVATTNGVAIVLIMAARVGYGMAQAGRLPTWVGHVSPATRTPLRATVLVTAVVLLLALFVPLGLLAETTSVFLLMVFAVVNFALLWMKVRHVPAPKGAFQVSMLVPALGTLSCAGLLAGAIVAAL